MLCLNWAQQLSFFLKFVARQLTCMPWHALDIANQNNTKEQRAGELQPSISPNCNSSGQGCCSWHSTTRKMSQRRHAKLNKSKHWQLISCSSNFVMTVLVLHDEFVESHLFLNFSLNCLTEPKTRKMMFSWQQEQSNFSSLKWEDLWEVVNHWSFLFLFRGKFLPDILSSLIAFHLRSVSLINEIFVSKFDDKVSESLMLVVWLDHIWNFNAVVSVKCFLDFLMTSLLSTNRWSTIAFLGNIRPAGTTDGQCGFCHGAFEEVVLYIFILFCQLQKQQPTQWDWLLQAAWCNTLDAT